jgi:hypothetical protein
MGPPGLGWQERLVKVRCSGAPGGVRGDVSPQFWGDREDSACDANALPSSAT